LTIIFVTRIAAIEHVSRDKLPNAEQVGDGSRKSSITMFSNYNVNQFTHPVSVFLTLNS